MPTNKVDVEQMTENVSTHIEENIKHVNEHVSYTMLSLEVRKHLSGPSAIYKFITKYLTNGYGSLFDTKSVLIALFHPKAIGIRELGHERITWEGKERRCLYAKRPWILLHWKIELDMGSANLHGQREVTTLVKQLYRQIKRLGLEQYVLVTDDGMKLADENKIITMIYIDMTSLLLEKPHLFYGLEETLSAAVKTVQNDATSLGFGLQLKSSAEKLTTNLFCLDPYDLNLS